jgi:hypothetical protein
MGTSQGQKDGFAAVAELANELFPANNTVVIYLDVEKFGDTETSLSLDMQQYIIAWCRAVELFGYKPGIYYNIATNATAISSIADDTGTNPVLWGARYNYTIVKNGTTIFPAPAASTDDPNADAWQYQEGWSPLTENPNPFSLSVPGIEKFGMDLDSYNLPVQTVSTVSVGQSVANVVVNSDQSLNVAGTANGTVINGGAQRM